MPHAVDRWDEMVFSIFVMLAQVGLEAYILGTLFHYVVKKDAKLEEFRSETPSATVLCQRCHLCVIAAVSSTASAACTHGISIKATVQMPILQSVCLGGHQHATCIILGPASEPGGASAFILAIAVLSWLSTQ